MLKGSELQQIQEFLRGHAAEQFRLDVEELYSIGWGDLPPDQKFAAMQELGQKWKSEGKSDEWFYTVMMGVAAKAQDLAEPCPNLKLNSSEN